MVAYISCQLNVLLIFRFENEQHVHSTFSDFTDRLREPYLSIMDILKKHQKNSIAVCQKKHNQLMVWKADLSCPSMQQTL